MPDRKNLARSFLATTDWANARRAPLAGDASNRRYERLTDPVSLKTAVLMDAPPERGEDVRPFLRIARHLTALGLSAPEILAEDVPHGFLLIEDLGDDLFARVIPAQPGLEPDLYAAATDVLLVLHRADLPPLAAYNTAVMTDLAALALTQYRRAITGDNGPESAFRDTFETVLDGLTPMNSVLIQRDYHAENLLWLPHRQGVARVGLLDFQDAMSGHPAYDLVSLLQDARRDVAPRIETEMITRYLAETGLDRDAFEVAYAALGVQRNLRILGVFARLARAYGKPHYVDLIPRVWAHLTRDLQHPALTPVAGLLQQALPPPDPETLQKLKRS
ncbi:aminoglycoside phosphotransferase family protein [Sedimentitalea sp. HM32M-2]|uniref:aminoglycoside phosphotransferase family protein n=1 Tax=Sedimentitalea sp. HM32M-2 TaxID=3351566 RepID=UPI003638D90B